MAAALEEVSSEVGHIGAHLFEEREGGRCGVAKVHRAFVDVGEHHFLVEVVDAAWVVANVGGDGVVFGGDEVNVCSFVGLGVEHRLQNRVGNLCLRTADDQRAADVDVRVVVHQLRTGVGARRARQTGVERDTVVFVVPRVVNDVELVAAVEQSNRARNVAQVTAVALVHLELVASCHVS